VAEVAGRADGDFEHLASRLTADPSSSAGEEEALEESDVLVVSGRVAILQLTHPLGFRVDFRVLAHAGEG
jgi:hypothetical protein